jgi:glutaminase
LLELTARYLLENGVLDLSLRTLGDAIGSSHRVLLYYFESREQLITEALDEAARLSSVRDASLLGPSGTEPDIAGELVRVWRQVSADDQLPLIRLFLQVVALALHDTDRAALGRVGIEPTGEAFDAITLETGTGRPPNPMVNAGAILTSSIVDGGDVDARTERIVSGLSAFAGRPLQIDDHIAASEHLFGDRNHALAHLMRAEGTLHVGADEAILVYARACAVLVDTADLATMGATLAAGGTNPRTGERVVSREVARDVISVMATCGVYDGSGRWMREVGVPAKSSVSGALVLAVPGVLGAAVVSPPLDERGTSVRGHRVSDRLSADLGLHAFAV